MFSLFRYHRVAFKLEASVMFKLLRALYINWIASSESDAENGVKWMMMILFPHQWLLITKGISLIVFSSFI